MFIIAVTPTKFKRIVTNHNSDSNPAGAITAPIWPPGGEEAVADTKRIRAETLADKRSLAAGSATPCPGQPGAGIKKAPCRINREGVGGSNGTAESGSQDKISLVTAAGHQDLFLILPGSWRF